MPYQPIGRRFMPGVGNPSVFNGVVPKYNTVAPANPSAPAGSSAKPPATPNPYSSYPAGYWPADSAIPGHDYSWTDITNPADTAAGIRRYIDDTGHIRTIRANSGIAPSAGGGGGGGGAARQTLGYGNLMTAADWAGQAMAKYNKSAGMSAYGGTAPDWIDYEGAGAVYTPKAWDEGALDIPEVSITAQDVVDAHRHQFEEQMQKSWGDAARRFGAAGALVSGGTGGTGYSGVLGEAERKRDADIAALYTDVDKELAMSDADRKLAAMEAAKGRAFGAYQLGENIGASQFGAAQDRALQALLAKNQFNLGKYGYQMQYQPQSNISLDQLIQLSGMLA